MNSSAAQTIMEIAAATFGLAERLPGIPGLVSSIINSIIQSGENRLEELEELREQVLRMVDEGREPASEEWGLLKARKREEFRRLDDILQARRAKREDELS